MSDASDHAEPGAATWLQAVRRSHDRLTATLNDLAEAEVTKPSYAREWSVAQVASHLGSQAEIFEIFLAAGLADLPAPGGEAFGPIWDRWDGLDPMRQVHASIAANESFVSRIESLPEPEAQRFEISMFGTDLDLAALLALRLAEHAVHTWDIEVVLDPDAVVAADAVELLADGMPQRVERVGTPQPDVEPVVVETTDPAHRWWLTASPSVTLTPVEDVGANPLRLSAETFLLLVNGRLGEDRTPVGADAERLATWRTVFRGF